MNVMRELPSGSRDSEVKMTHADLRDLFKVIAGHDVTFRRVALPKEPDDIHASKATHAAWYAALCKITLEFATHTVQQHYLATSRPITIHDIHEEWRKHLLDIRSREVRSREVEGRQRAQRRAQNKEPGGRGWQEATAALMAARGMSQSDALDQVRMERLAKNVPCPHCQAAPNKSCTRWGEKEKSAPHPARVEAYREQQRERGQAA